MNALDDAGQLHPHLGLLRGRKDVDDAVDGLGSAGGVQRRHDQVAGLGCRDGGPMVSRSRISPTSTTSGSSRRAARRPERKRCCRRRSRAG